MEQMRKPEAPVVARLRRHEVDGGFARDSEGKIWFLTSQGDALLRLPVMEDGTICRHQLGGYNCIMHPYEEVVIVPPRHIGITEIRFTPPPDDTPTL